MLALILALQVAYPPAMIDTSALPSKADVQAAADAAATAQSAASAAQAAIPPKCTTMPAPDTYTGKIGTAAGCVPPADAARQTQVQSTTATTASDGTFSGSWATAFTATPSYAHAEINSGSTPFVCQITTATTSGYTGKCFQVISTTLPGTLLALGGLVVSPISSAAAGYSVKIIARQ